MKVFVTGGTGFIGGHVVSKLRARGDEIVALARDPAKATRMREAGCEIADGDISDRARLAKSMEGVDAVIHGAAIYEVGIPAGRRPAMRKANVEGTENVLGAALDAGVAKALYISTIAAFGNTNGEVVDESFEHRGAFTSYYEETKVEAHQVALRLIGEGLPCVIVQPGGVYGPEDHSQIGNQIKLFNAGKMPFMTFPDLGFNLVHVEDAADGVLLALDSGKVGEKFVLGGEMATMGQLISTFAGIVGKKPPRRTLPPFLIKLGVPFGPVIGPLMGFPPNLRELVSSADGVTFFASHDKAVRELGYAPRSLEQGLRDTLAAEGRLDS